MVVSTSSKCGITDSSTMLNQERLGIDDNPDFSEILSQRRTHSEGMGDLLHWWRFDSETQKVDTYEVLILHTKARR